jgi:hypothetical protein
MTLHGVSLVKANSSVTHGQLNLSRIPAEFHSEVPTAAVLHRIL